MKIFYTTDGSIDNNLIQICPFGEKHHFTRDDGSSWDTPKCVGCGGCTSCKYCYGASYREDYENDFALFPVENTPMAKFDSWSGASYSQAKAEQEALGLKQWTLRDQDWVKCARVFTEEYRQKSKSLAFKIWWWHHIAKPVKDAKQELEYRWSSFKYKVQRKVERFKEKRNTNG